MSWVSNAVHKATGGLLSGGIGGLLKPALNPLKFGDALGLTYGPLSGRIPGKLTDRGITAQQSVLPFFGRKTLEKANDIAPYVAGAIAGGSFLSAATSGGAAASEASSVGFLDNVSPFVGDLPLDSAEEITTGAFDMEGSAGVFDSAGNPLYNSPGISIPAGLQTLGVKALDYVIARNLQGAKAKAANSNRAPLQSDVSPYGNWGNPAHLTGSASGNSSTMILVGIGALLIILLFFMRGK